MSQLLTKFMHIAYREGTPSRGNTAPRVKNMTTLLLPYKNVIYFSASQILHNYALYDMKIENNISYLKGKCKFVELKTCREGLEVLVHKDRVEVGLDE